METENNTSPTCFRILMFPWLAHGHIFPFLELAKRILKRRNFHIYFCTTPINFSSIKNFIDKNSPQDSIQLIEFNLNPFPGLPPHYHTTKDLPPDLNPTLHFAFQASKPVFSDILNAIKPDLVIYDMMQPWASDIASSQLGIPAVYFSIFGAATLAYVHYHYTFPKDPVFPFSEIISLSEYEKENLGSMLDFLSDNVLERDKDSVFLNFRLSSEFVLFKSCRVFEGKYLNYLSLGRQKELVTVGPLVSYPSSNLDEENMEIMQWLSKRDECSTVYISFGSEYFLSKLEIQEIAKGLELCDNRVNFIWVIRFPFQEGKMSTNSNRIEESLPNGFLERVKERGIVVEGWAPQANILAHKNTGAFISHCGWSSIMETLCFGVPMIGMPMKINMFMDARMLVDVGACFEVSRDGDNKYRGEEIAKAINEVIVGKSVGERMRIKARELGEKMKMEEEGTVEEAAHHLWNLCLKHNKLPRDAQ